MDNIHQDQKAQNSEHARTDSHVIFETLVKEMIETRVLESEVRLEAKLQSILQALVLLQKKIEIMAE